MIKRFLKNNWILIAIFITALFLRLYKLNDLFFFNIDEDWVSYIFRKIYFDHKPVLIGWEIPGGIQVPPIIYYYGAFIYLIFKGNPIGLAINAAIINSLGVILIYYIGKGIFRSAKLGIFSAILYSVSYLNVIYSKVSLTIYVGPVLSLLTYVSLYKIVNDKNKNWLFILSLVLIFSTQEGSLISLIILTILCLLLFRKKLKLRELFLPGIIFLSSFIPLLIFDLRHDFQLTRNLINFSKLGHISEQSVNFYPYISLYFRSIARTIIPTGPFEINKQLLPCISYLKDIDNSTPIIFPFLVLFTILLFIIKPVKDQFIKKIILLHLLIILFGLLIYSIINKGHLYEWFFILTIPASIIMVTFLFSLLEKLNKKLSFFLLLVLISINLYFILSNKSDIGYSDKLAAVKYSSNLYKNEKFNVEMIGNGCNGYGYRYLFTYLNNEPQYSYMDNQYNNWLYIKNSTASAKNTIYIVPKNDLDTQTLQDKYSNIESKALNKKSFGNLEIISVKNN